MSVIKFRPDEQFESLGPGSPPPAPVGELLSKISSHAFPSETVPQNRSGVWRCTPGRWRRQVKQAEFCYFVSGTCVFQPDEGKPVNISAGDAIYFPANTDGVWSIETECQKIFVIFDEA